MGRFCASTSSTSIRPRVLLTGVPIVHGAEKVMDILEAPGAMVVAQESCTGLKPIDGDAAESGDPVDAIARKYYGLPCSCMTPNAGRIDLLDRLIEELRPEGVVDLIWQACLTYEVESRRVRRYAEEKLGIPYLRVETDYSPSDSARIASASKAGRRGCRPERARGISGPRPDGTCPATGR